MWRRGISSSQGVGVASVAAAGGGRDARMWVAVAGKGTVVDFSEKKQYFSKEPYNIDYCRSLVPGPKGFRRLKQSCRLAN